MRVLGTVVLMLALACGSRQSPAESEEQQKVEAPRSAPDAGFVNRGPGVWLRVTPVDAELIVDGESIGPANTLDATEGFLELEAGIHQIVVRKEGFTTWRAEVAVKVDTQPIDITLEPVAAAD